MGRVRRYKKVKSCDTFAKKKVTLSKGENKYDQPPSVFEENGQLVSQLVFEQIIDYLTYNIFQAKRAQKRRERGLDQENLDG